MSLVTPKAIHKAGFHPTAVIGAIAAAAACARALALPAPQIASAMGIAGSMASGIIEYLAQGTWTKRMHAGWAAQSGLKAALLARAGFEGPQTVLEGTHGFYKAFAPSAKPDFAPLLDDLGTTWRMQQIAFKPYACGTMTQPYIDVALALRARQVPPADIAQHHLQRRRRHRPPPLGTPRDQTRPRPPRMPPNSAPPTASPPPTSTDAPASPSSPPPAPPTPKYSP